MSSVADLLTAGRNAMMQGRADQAIAILTTACIKQSSRLAPDPRPWFHLAASHAMASQHDVASLLFLKAKIEAQNYLSNPKVSLESYYIHRCSIVFYRDTLKLRGITPVSMNAAPKTAHGLFTSTAGLPARGG